MGRPRKGYTIRWRGRAPSVRFTHDGKPYDLGLGTRDREQAGLEAARLYADVVSGNFKPKSIEAIVTGKKTTEVGGEWLDSLQKQLRANTRATYEQYVIHLARRMPMIADFTDENLDRYASGRLCEVTKKTLRHELSAAKTLSRFAHGKGYLAKRPAMPEIDRSAHGTQYKDRRRVAAPPLAPHEIEGLLAALPEWSRARFGMRRHPIRARFIVAYEMALRPEFVDKISVPTHWDRGRTELYIPPIDDKMKQGRYVPLTARAIAALESVAPESGVVFGHHDYRERLRAAAMTSMTKEKAELFCGQHLRSAGGTHLLELSKGNLTGVQGVMGHSKVSTTARYMRTSEQQTAVVISIASRKRRRSV